MERPKAGSKQLPIFVINLVRRPDRRRAMESKLGDIGLLDSAVFIDAIDGRHIDEEWMKQRGASVHSRWKLSDPSAVDWGCFPPWDVQWWRQAYDRSMKNGELGCALSHVGIWEQIVREEMPVAIVLEDDVALAPNFADAIEQACLEIQQEAWDILLLGRSARILPDQYQSELLMRPGYSSGTPGYVLALRGAMKLLGPELAYAKNIIPLDEFLPALYTRHPRRDLHQHFGTGDMLSAFALRDDLVTPEDHDDSDTKRSAYHSAQVHPSLQCWLQGERYEGVSATKIRVLQIMGPARADVSGRMRTSLTALADTGRTQDGGADGGDGDTGGEGEREGIEGAHSYLDDQLQTSHLFLGDAGAAQLASVLEHNASLTHLKIGRNRIGPVGMSALVLALTDDDCAVQLAALEVQENEIGDEGAALLACLLASGSGSGSGSGGDRQRRGWDWELSSASPSLSASRGLSRSERDRLRLLEDGGGRCVPLRLLRAQANGISAAGAAAIASALPLALRMATAASPVSQLRIQLGEGAGNDDEEGDGGDGNGRRSVTGGGGSGSSERADGMNEVGTAGAEAIAAALMDTVDIMMPMEDKRARAVDCIHRGVQLQLNDTKITAEGISALGRALAFQQLLQQREVEDEVEAERAEGAERKKKWRLLTAPLLGLDLSRSTLANEERVRALLSLGDSTHANDGGDGDEGNRDGGEHRQSQSRLQLPPLQRLRLDCCGITSAGASILSNQLLLPLNMHAAPALPPASTVAQPYTHAHAHVGLCLHQLLQLSLNGNRLIGDEGVICLSRALRGNCNIDGDRGGDISSASPPLPPEQEQPGHGHGRGHGQGPLPVAAAAAAAAAAATPTPLLRRLELCAVGASDRCAAELALALQQCPQPLQLRLAENRIGYGGALLMVQAIRHRQVGEGAGEDEDKGEMEGGEAEEAEEAAEARLMQQLALQGVFAYDVAALHPSRLDSHQARSLVVDPGVQIFRQPVMLSRTGLANPEGQAEGEEEGEDDNDAGGLFVDLTHNLLFKVRGGGLGLAPYYTQHCPRQQQHVAGGDAEEGEDEGEGTDASLDDPFGLDSGDDY